MSEFDGLIYFVVDYDNIPSGWSNQEKRDSRKRVNRGVGKQNKPQPHLNTVHRLDVKTIFDDEGVLTQTAGKAMFRVDTDMTDAELIDAVIAEMADELDKTINAVEQKVSVTVIGGQAGAIAHINANPASWGERVS